MKILGGGKFDGPVNIIYKGAIKCSNNIIHQICNHITFTDICIVLCAILQLCDSLFEVGIFFDMIGGLELETLGGLWVQAH
jgi:hypothetical protein